MSQSIKPWPPVAIKLLVFVIIMFLGVIVFLSLLPEPPANPELIKSKTMPNGNVVETWKNPDGYTYTVIKLHK
jgi:hypothetical protein